MDKMYTIAVAGTLSHALICTWVQKSKLLGNVITKFISTNSVFFLSHMVLFHATEKLDLNPWDGNG